MQTKSFSFSALHSALFNPAERFLRPCLIAGMVSLSLWSAPLQAQDAKTGLTGEAHAADLVQARQMLMDSLEEQMMAVEAALSGKDPKIVDLQNRAYQMNILFSAFPHLFAPQTQPAKGNNDPGYQTNAMPKVWQDFDRFYEDVQNAAGISLAASQAKDMPGFRDQIQKLRNSCDSCHADFMTPVSDPHGP